MRVFYAIPLWSIPELRGFLKSFTWSQVRWVKPELIHLTLKFLGEIQSDEIDKAQAVLEDAGRLFPPFFIRWDRTGVFPNWREPRVLWLGVKNQAATPLKALAMALGNPELAPHVTVGRVRKPLPLELKKEWEDHQVHLPTVEVGRIHLIKSQLTPGGPLYSSIGWTDLEGGKQHE